MKTHFYRYVWMIGIIAGMVIGSGSADLMAQEQGLGFTTGLNLGAVRFSDGDLGTGFGGRGFIEFAPYIPEISLKISGGYLRFQDDVTLGQGAFTSSENIVFEDFYVTGGLVYRVLRGKIVPFLTANCGVYHYRKEDVDSAAGPVIDGVQVSPYDTVSSEEGNDFGFNAGGGVEYFMDSRVSMSLEMLLHSIMGEVNSEIFDVSVMFRFFPER